MSETVQPRDSHNGWPRNRGHVTSPLLIKVHKGSTFNDLDYICEQVLAFASNSWRNFSPTSLPVTILYAELIAGLLGRLGNLSRWDADVLRGPAGQSRWFL